MEDWDLYAVVRGCAATSSSSTPISNTTTSSGQPFNNFLQDCDFSHSQDPFEPVEETFFQELHDLYKPFFPKSQQQPSQTTPLSPQSIPFSPLSVLGGLQDLFSEQQIIKQLPPQTTQFRPKQPCFSVANSSKAGSPHSLGPRSKRRKNHMKRICHVAAENLSSDMWSWRKYGQKPIKGSPYPRGYYRCSTSKGCLARKQVERNRSDPGMFIVTYTAEHNHPMPTHRNSLAGITRQKPAGDVSNRPSGSPVTSPATSLSPAPEKLESSPEDEEEDFCGSNTELDDNFFAGLEDLPIPAAGECFSDDSPQSLAFPWLANSGAATTTAAGGS